ncbi:MAG: LytTR family DNA-binding domain-containing protein [Flavobacteriaceae bacterium]|nr:LytTR family DNA-binding domain-containing protein [Flavobacteriaceae bacterium]
MNKHLKHFLIASGLALFVLVFSWFKQNAEPDVIFLDIQLGDGISFEIFEEIQPKSFIIFTTAYDQYALRAFKLNSIDYLLKPIQEMELQRAIEKFKSTKLQSIVFTPLQIRELLEANFENKFRERFLVKIGQKFKRIETDKIALFYSENKGTYIQTEFRNYLIDHSIEEIEEQVNPERFFRISRQALVHLPFINEIISHSGSRLLLTLEGSDKKWLVSREKVQDFKNWLAQ